MSYIGKEPIVGNFQVCDAISVVNGQAAYTMQVSSVNVVPESANHMLVSLNGILQKPNSSFTVSGSTITFASNLATGDVIDFIMLLGNVLDIGTPSDSTVTDAKANFVSTSSGAGLQIKGDGTTNGTLQLNCSQNSHGVKIASPAHSAGQSYTLTLPTGNVTADKFLKVASVSGSGTTGIGQLSFADAGGTTPAFAAERSATVTGLSDNSYVKVSCDTEILDSDNTYDNSSNYRFTPGVAGKYFIYGSVMGRGDVDGIRETKVAIYKNGTRVSHTTTGNRGSEVSTSYDGISANIGVILDSDDNDYFELYAQMDVASGNARYQGTEGKTVFGGFKIA